MGSVEDTREVLDWVLQSKCSDGSSKGHSLAEVIRPVEVGFQWFGRPEC